MGKFNLRVNGQPFLSGIKAMSASEYEDIMKETDTLTVFNLYDNDRKLCTGTILDIKLNIDTANKTLEYHLDNLDIKVEIIGMAYTKELNECDISVRKREKSEFITKDLLEKVLKIKTNFREKPDLEYIDCRHKRHGIEITEACNGDFKRAENCNSTDTRDKSVRSYNKKNKKAEISVVNSNLGIVADIDYGVDLIKQAVKNKNQKEYNGFDTLWLAIYCGFEIHYLNLCIEKIAKVSLGKFDGLYIVAIYDRKLYKITGGDITEYDIEQYV